MPWVRSTRHASVGTNGPGSRLRLFRAGFGSDGAIVALSRWRENPLPVREGVTSKQVIAELVAMIEAAGLLPTKLKNGGGVINVTPQRMESQSG
jgi:hypothetical protein